MNVLSMACASCGAPIKVPADIEQLNCAYCGAGLVVQRGEGYVALKVAEQLSKTIEDTAQQTKAAISEGTQVTQAELRRIQLTQELSTATTRLGNIQAQIRFLQNQKQSRYIKKQLNSLRGEESNAIQKINSIRRTLSPESVNDVKRIEQKKIPFRDSPFNMGCLTFWIILLIGTVTLGAAVPSEITTLIILLISISSGLYVARRVTIRVEAARKAQSPEPSEVSTQDIKQDQESK